MHISHSFTCDDHALKFYVILKNKTSTYEYIIRKIISLYNKILPENGLYLLHLKYQTNNNKKKNLLFLQQRKYDAQNVLKIQEFKIEKASTQPL